MSFVIERFLTVSLLFSLLLLAACGKKEHKCKGINTIADSQLIAIYEREGYDEVFIVNQDGDEVAHYVLLDNADFKPEEIPEGADVLRVPLSKLVVDSEVYAAALEELKTEDVIKGMFDPGYVTSTNLQTRIASGQITDMGSVMAPNIEKVISKQPEALIISYYDGMQTQGLEKTGIPVIKMYDLQEKTPLGRAEWLRFLGRLVGREAMADSIFSEVKERYQKLRLSSNVPETTSELPKVLTDISYQGTWSVPGGDSFHAKLIRDAGGNYFKAANHSSGSLNLSPEQVLCDGGDSDTWIIKYYGSEEQLNAILESDPVYREIKAWKEGNIYFSDTSKSGLFREFPFHPDLLLKDYSLIFNNDTLQQLRYFKKLNQRKDISKNEDRK